MVKNGGLKVWHHCYPLSFNLRWVKAAHQPLTHQLIHKHTHLPMTSELAGILVKVEENFEAYTHTRAKLHTQARAHAPAQNKQSVEWDVQAERATQLFPHRPQMLSLSPWSHILRRSHFQLSSVLWIHVLKWDLFIWGTFCKNLAEIQ